jgi:hypothetical protein
MQLALARQALPPSAENRVEVVYTANPLNGNGIGIDVEYLPSQILRLRGQA